MAIKGPRSPKWRKISNNPDGNSEKFSPPYYQGAKPYSA